MPSYRSSRLPVVIKKTLSALLARDFNLEDTLVTITDVVLNKNLDQAKVGLSILPLKQANHVLKELNNRQWEFQNKLIKKTNTRYVPKIEFVLDEGLANAARVDKLLDN